ncbi:MAG TPA: glycosyltransferase [Candidatus Sulfotelmatobacter sp.]|nr:glycosyltransferase [Candidatus Sulfotelmatobacter sp.]
MSTPTQNQSASEAASCASPNNQWPGFPKPIFLMVNSLERGGSERQFVELAGSLKSAQCSVHLGCLQKVGPFLEDLERSGFPELVPFDTGGSLYGLESWKTRWQLMRHLRKLEIAVAHSFDFYVNLTMVPAAKMAGVPVIGSQRQLGDLLTWAQSRAQLEVFRWCDRVVCNSKAAADRLVQAGLRASKLVVIGNGLPPDAFAKTAAVLPRQDGILRVGMIARMNIRAKNQDSFLRATARLRSKFPEAEFLLVGDGPFRGELEKLASDLGIQRQTRFLGDRRDIGAILASMDISVVASSSESLSNVMLESMAAGVPVIATSVGGNVELGGDDRALLIPANNDEALAVAIQTLLSDANVRREAALRARRFAEGNFSLERIREKYCDLYSELATARAR